MSTCLNTQGCCHVTGWLGICCNGKLIFLPKNVVSLYVYVTNDSIVFENYGLQYAVLTAIFILPSTGMKSVCMDLVLSH